MTTLTPLAVCLIGLVGLSAGIAVWAQRRPALKLVQIALAAGIMLAGYAAMADLLSRPKPVRLEWWHLRVDEATVLGYSLRENEAIWLWLGLDGLVEPRAYVLPWHRPLAEQLQSAARDAARDGTAVRMRLPFEPTLDDREPMFYALPQPALPEKDAPAMPQLYEEDA